jgi:pimeloyl-ACP methyl ester carboxylesterase
MAAAFRRFASFSRVIMLDKRGTGLSDRVPNDRLPTLEERMDDVRVVMDAAGSERAAFLGYWEGGRDRGRTGAVQLGKPSEAKSQDPESSA